MKRERFDLVDIDVLMSVTDGIVLTVGLRADPRRASLALLGVTAKASSTKVQACREASLNDVITNLFRNKTLLAAIDTVMEKSVPR